MKIINPILAILLFLSIGCKKEEIAPPTSTTVPRPITIRAQVPSNIYTNRVKDLSLDASQTVLYNGVRTLNFLWTCTSYPANQPPVIVNPTKVSTGVDKLLAGQYQFNLKVSDVAGNEATEDFMVTVLKDTLSSAPIIKQLPDMTVELPSLTTQLNGQDNYNLNPAGRELQFLWTLISAPANSSVVIINANRNLAGIDIVKPGHYTISLKLTNELGLSTSDTFNIVALSDPLSGTEKIYDNVDWIVGVDGWGPYAYLEIKDPALGIKRSNINTWVEIWDQEKQQWNLPSYYYVEFTDGIIVATYDNTEPLKGKKARVRVRFL